MGKRERKRESVCVCVCDSGDKMGIFNKVTIEEKYGKGIRVEEGSQGLSLWMIESNTVTEFACIVEKRVEKRRKVFE